MVRFDRESRSPIAREDTRPTRRVSLLVFACAPEEVQLLMNKSANIEITYLPNATLEEALEEIEHLHPNLIVCGQDAFLDASSMPRPKRIGASLRHPPDLADSTPNLPYRERRILLLVVEGQTNEQIAKTMRLSTRTIKRSITSLFERFRVANRTELARRSAELSLVEKQ